jgi:hypothetical protein
VGEDVRGDRRLLERHENLTLAIRILHVFSENENEDNHAHKVSTPVHEPSRIDSVLHTARKKTKMPFVLTASCKGTGYRMTGKNASTIQLKIRVSSFIADLDRSAFPAWTAHCPQRN